MMTYMGRGHGTSDKSAGINPVIHTVVSLSEVLK